jgi:acyl carrier protein
MATRFEIEEWLKERIAGKLQVPPDSIDVDTTFDRYSFNSLVAVDLSSELGAWLSIDMSTRRSRFWPNTCPDLPSDRAGHLAGAQSELGLAAFDARRDRT